MDTAKLTEVILDDIISAMGYEEGDNRAEYVAKVQAMDPEKALQLWSRWHLGSSGWGDTFLYVWRELEAASKQEGEG
jgi:hypothetical protein